MWVEMTKEGRYKFSERYEDPMTGKQKKVSITLEKDSRQARKEAEQILAEKIKKKLASSDSPEKEYSIKELAGLYYIHQKQFSAISTANRNRSTLNSIMKLLGEDVLAGRLTARYFNANFEASGLPASTLNEYIKRFKAMIRWAFDNDYVHDITFLGKIHLFKDIPHRAKIQDKYLNGAELEKVLLSMQDAPCWFLLTKFLAFSGLRFGELCALNRTDVDLDALEIHVTKQYDSNNEVVTEAKSVCSVRDVHIQPELLEVCRSILAFMDRRRLICGLGRRAALFMFSEDGSHISYFAYAKYLKHHAMEITGKRITPHALRHTHASLLYEAGFTIDEVARRLGHANSKVTRDVYLHVTSKLKEQDNKKLDAVRFIRHG